MLSNERELQRLIDTAVGRAMFDRKFAFELLADPTLVLAEHGCAPQHYRELRTIRAHDLRDFATQALALFWPARGPRAAEVSPLAVGL